MRATAESQMHDAKWEEPTQNLNFVEFQVHGLPGKRKL